MIFSHQPENNHFRVTNAIELVVTTSVFSIPFHPESQLCTNQQLFPVKRDTDHVIYARA